MNLPPQVQQANNLILQQEQQFSAVLADEKINFQREAGFAIQLLRNNSYLCGIATKNAASLQDAVINIASIGISLNPADKHAYLVPRDGKVCLDLSYMGLLHIAIDSGSIQWGQCKIVYAQDSYESNGVDKAPTHKYNAFSKDRGPIVGAYCTVKTAGGDYLTEEMDIEDIYRIRNRSASYKKKSGPWVTDENEMIRKTVVKRAYKYWPKSDRLNRAIDYSNTHGEGIDIRNEQAQQAEKCVNLSAEQRSMINELLEQNGIEWEGPLSSFMAGKFGRQVDNVDDLTEKEASQAISALQARLAKMQEAQA